MKNLLIAAGLIGAATLSPNTASAQAVADAKVGIVDVERVVTTCNACATALQAIEAQARAVQARETELGTPLQTQGQALQAEITALNGAEPSAALQQRAQAFEQQRTNAANEIRQRQATVQRNRNYVLQQIGTALDPVYRQVMASRGANMLIPQNNVLGNMPAVDMTGDVLAALNASLTTIQTQAPAPQQPAQQPAAQGR
ncbi:OmpH family outer membrane protein [Sphingomicrobium sp. XHP0235]|uniref:OmpH family outer membrane protein n=1 Tax=Sphingomicrobium aquimarinum TaxID=3133971 RepID=UPI0031FE7716